MGFSAGALSDILKAELGPGYWLVAAVAAGFLVKQLTGFLAVLLLHYRENKEINADISRKQKDHLRKLEQKTRRSNRTRGGQK